MNTTGTCLAWTGMSLIRDRFEPGVSQIGLGASSHRVAGESCCDGAAAIPALQPAGAGSFLQPDHQGDAQGCSTDVVGACNCDRCQASSPLRGRCSLFSWSMGRRKDDPCVASHPWSCCVTWIALRSQCLVLLTKPMGCHLPKQGVEMGWGWGAACIPAHLGMVG